MKTINGTENVFKELQKHRRVKGYSQEYMAEQLGISQRQYSRIENGRSKLGLQRLMTICHVLSVQIEDVLQSAWQE